MNSPNDFWLITQIVVFNRVSAFNTLVKKYQSPIRRFFLHQTVGNESLSDDLAQETFIKAYKNIQHFNKRSSFSTWLYRIAYNVFYDEVRSRKVYNNLDTSEAAYKMHIETKDVDTQLDVYASLKGLKEIERTCIMLRYIEDLSIKDIAAITKIPEGSIKSHISRGKVKMATYLKQNGYEK
ncbi:MAG: sigma-70 family RNA polymerase sigma factor [Bacteroidaceae bacterium]|nr:sigma-70 family RNA polymerase sigma factor [Bacteroidaceae bacterium]